jgi:hypothetical protein
MPIGGWLIVVAIFLFLTPLGVIGTFVRDKNFTMTAWGIAGKGNAHKTLLAFETIGDIIMICYAIFCLVLLFAKRDIFPRYIIGFFALSFVLSAVYCILITVLLHKAPATVHLIAGVRSIVFAAVGIPYFLKSSRVEETFIVPYPPYNYRYEGSPEKKAGNIE